MIQAMQRRATRLAIIFGLVTVFSACGSDTEVPTSDRSPTAGPGAVDATVAPARILFSRVTPNGARRFFVAAGDGSAEAPFLPRREVEVRSLSPDQARVAIVALDDSGSIVGGSVSTDGSDLRLFDPPDPAMNLACGVWAPGGRMACEGWDDSDRSRAGIYVVRASDGGGSRRLTRYRDVPCDYEPDGTRLAFVRVDAHDDAVGDLMVMDADGADARTVLDDVEIAGNTCDWAADGGSILVGSGGELLKVALDGTTTPIAGGGEGGWASGGVWSPDGASILFTLVTADDGSGVYTAGADGSAITRITESGRQEEAGVWFP